MQAAVPKTISWAQTARMMLPIQASTCLTITIIGLYRRRRRAQPTMQGQVSGPGVRQLDIREITIKCRQTFKIKVNVTFNRLKLRPGAVQLSRDPQAYANTNQMRVWKRTCYQSTLSKDRQTSRLMPVVNFNLYRQMRLSTQAEIHLLNLFLELILLRGTIARATQSLSTV